MRGQAQNVQAVPAPDEMHTLLARHATDEQVRQAHLCIGTVFETTGLRYRITTVHRDEYRRLIAVGKRMEEEA